MKTNRKNQIRTEDKKPNMKEKEEVRRVKTKKREIEYESEDEENTE